MKLKKNQKQEIVNLIAEIMSENQNDRSLLEDYWHGITTADGATLDINIFDAEVFGQHPEKKGLKCVVYAVENGSIDLDNYSLELYELGEI